MRETTIFSVLTRAVYIKDFLTSLYNQYYTKSDINLFLDTTGIDELGRELLDSFVAQYAGEYKQIIVHHDRTRRARELCIAYCGPNRRLIFTWKKASFFIRKRCGDSLI